MNSASMAANHVDNDDCLLGAESLLPLDMLAALGGRRKTGLRQMNSTHYGFDTASLDEHEAALG